MRASRYKRTARRSFTAALAIALLLVFAAGGTMAYLTKSAGKLQNRFEAAQAPDLTIEESFTEGGSTKSDVYVKLNGGRGRYYVRAAVIIGFQDEDGNVAAIVPQAGTDYSLSLGSGWTLASDGFYYSDSPVDAGGQTSDLIEICTALSSEYKLTVDVLAQCIAAPQSGEVPQWNRGE